MAMRGHYGTKSKFCLLSNSNIFAHADWISLTTFLRNIFLPCLWNDSLIRLLPNWVNGSKTVSAIIVVYVRVATAQGKQGIWKSIFPDRENTGNLLKNIKNMFLHREFTTNTGKILRVKKIMNLLLKWMELPSGCVVPGLWFINFWLLFCKLLRGLVKWIYSGLYGSLGKERMAMGGWWRLFTNKNILFFCR